MLHPISETNFLSELSDEQQEAIAGGGQLEDISKEVFTTFDASETLIKNTGMSGASGSGVGFEIANKAIKTAASEDLDVHFDTAPIVLGNHSWGIDP